MESVDGDPGGFIGEVVIIAGLDINLDTRQDGWSLYGI